MANSIAHEVGNVSQEEILARQSRTQKIKEKNQENRNNMKRDRIAMSQSNQSVIAELNAAGYYVNIIHRRWYDMFTYEVIDPKNNPHEKRLVQRVKLLSKDELANDRDIVQINQLLPNGGQTKIVACKKHPNKEYSFISNCSDSDTYDHIKGVDQAFLNEVDLLNDILDK